MAKGRKKLGEILVSQGVVTQEQLDEALAKAKQEQIRVGEALTALGYTDSHQILKALSSQHGIKYVDLKNEKVAKLIDKSAIDSSVMKKHLVLGLGKSGGKMRVALHDPLDLEVLDNLRFRLNADVEPLLATKEQLQEVIHGDGDAGGSGGAATDAGGVPKQSLVTDSIDRTIDRSVDSSMDKSIDVSAEGSPVVVLVDRILDEAVRMRTSDIHVEPMEDRIRLRYRVDGVCIERDNLPKRMQNALLSRLKLMAGMNISERRVPQDGRIKIHVDLGEDEPTPIDFRVSACPAYHGESVVLRILRPDAVRIGLENLGFEPENLEIFNRIIRRPNGIFLVTGPTGSGKTTTLYSALDVLNRPDRKIITAEDPVEYNFDGINQCQVRDDIGLTFPAILRSMLRQAPNVILVGEIRDREVGEIAIQAALTGHLVFSTLHTNDAPSAITRLIDMGIKPFLVASSIQAVMAQRLIRTLAKSKQLATADDLDPKYLHLIGIEMDDALGKVYKPIPSEEAPNGYRGRKGIFEMMKMNPEIRDLAFNKAQSSEIRHAAIAAGMTQLVEDGRRKVLNGVTTPDEIARVSQIEGSGGH